MSSEISRRKFLKTGVIAAAGLTVVPNTILGKNFGHVAPSDKLNILGVGVGGRGGGVLKEMESENIIGMADVDWGYCSGRDGKSGIFGHFPNAKKFKDYRKMYEELGKSADAVVVGTADHVHAIIAAEAMLMGKSVYVEKPLTHSVYESRLLTKLAETTKVATQMGNQGSSGKGVRQVCSWIWNGEIGEVTKVETFTNRPIWPQGLNRPTGKGKAPKTLDWDLFIGTAQYREYNEIYTPWNWRGWWDFGTGALGDMACHILHPVFKGLNLGYPNKIEATSTLLLSDCAPHAEKVKFTFPARNNMPKVGMPEVEVWWYDGGIRPDLVPGLPEGKSTFFDGDGGVIFHGTKDTLICGCYGRDPFLASGRMPKTPEAQRVVPNDNHAMDFVRAAKESAANRTQTASPFAEAGPFNEMVVMGVNAVRLQGLNQELHWDGQKMEFTNIPVGATIRSTIRDKFTIKDGHPSFGSDMTEAVNAREFAKELVNHTYRDGWKLPNMPK